MLQSQYTGVKQQADTARNGRDQDTTKLSIGPSILDNPVPQPRGSVMVKRGPDGQPTVNGGKNPNDRRAFPSVGMEHRLNDSVMADQNDSPRNQGDLTMVGKPSFHLPLNQLQGNGARVVLDSSRQGGILIEQQDSYSSKNGGKQSGRSSAASKAQVLKASIVSQNQFNSPN